MAQSIALARALMDEDASLTVSQEPKRFRFVEFPAAQAPARGISRWFGLDEEHARGGQRSIRERNVGATERGAHDLP
ncbi:MAG TPA: hypothetical protein VHK24_04150 [Steroidobacter sp.]|jgi:hypothetical protein|nr:hypothetical protein [Steroidobacter sp.]